LLQGRRVGDILGGDVLNLLRRSIFRPSELAKFKTEARENAVCGSCHQVIRSRSLVTYDADSGQIYCTGCTTPSIFTCPGCRTRLKLPNGALTRILAKLTKECNICTERAAGKTVQTPEDTAEELRRQMQRDRPDVAIPTPVREARRTGAGAGIGRGIAHEIEDELMRQSRRAAERGTPLTLNQLGRLREQLVATARQRELRMPPPRPGDTPVAPRGNATLADALFANTNTIATNTANDTGWTLAGDDRPRQDLE
jgi:hypothetical protein